MVRETAASMGLTGLKVAAVSGDDVLARLGELGEDLRHLETGAKLGDSSNQNFVTANVYLGAAPIVEALKNGADIVITGRVADPCLYLAPLIAHPERFLNAHWLNPAYLVPLVELSPHPGTDAGVLARAKALLESIGKVPVVCAPAPGFIVPRLQALVMAEAARMVEEGVATPEDIDKATRFGFGFRYASIGVVEFIDYGGNDILYYACRYLAQALGERYTAPAIVNRMMR